MAMIADAFVSRFTDLLGKFVEVEVRLLHGVPGEIEKLQCTLRTINSVLVDAERKRINDEAINNWLKELKDVMYDADDILDQIEVENGVESFMASWENYLCPRLSNLSPSTLWEQFLLPLLTCCQKTAVTHQIGSAIKKLNGRLQEISERKSRFHLELNSPENRQKTSQISRHTSHLVEPNIVGYKIEEDTVSLVNKLLTAQDMMGNVLVFAIMGLGGIGKTTLAQKIFNDQRIEDNFQTKIWICVSQEFSEIELLKKITIVAGGGVRGGAEDRSQLEPLVMEQLKGKKFLLVLDDIWKVEVWKDLLRKPLQSGAIGSRVLITTRTEKVARQMKAVHYHHVEKLSPEDGWAILCKEVVLSPSDILNLKDIGMEIVSKCDGLPLAIKTIGGVLCMKNRTRNAWEGVLQSTTWSLTRLPEEIQAALYLSYEDLPTHLKQCFLYCSLFPEDQTIFRLHLIRLWISEGFVEVQEGSSMEDVGNKYYTELIMRNLLVPDPEYYEYTGSKMHDLLRSLAQFLTRDESRTFRKIEDINNSIGLMKLRRVSITDEDMTEAPDDLTKQESVRTLMINGCPIYRIDDLIDNFSRLRVLYLRNTLITNLPDSLGDLIHLRYLDLSWSKIGMIPETIGSLKNLSYLFIQGCENLNVLPNGIVNLQNLRALDVRGTRLDGLPSGLGRLQHLCVLYRFVVPWNSAEGFSTLEELRNLSQLERLMLERLERASSSSEARGPVLLDKRKLVVLDLLCTPQRTKEEQTEEEHTEEENTEEEHTEEDTDEEEHTEEEEEHREEEEHTEEEDTEEEEQMEEYTEEEIKKIKEVFEQLHPPPCLEEMQIHGYFGHEFPTWMTAVTSSSASNLPNLRYLYLKGCRNCERLPPLGIYSNLDYLSIYRAESVTSIGHEFLQGGSCDTGGNAGVYLFPKLEQLLFVNMPNWEEWEWENGVQAMPCLKLLDLTNCPKLRSLPKGLLCHATALTKLVICDCNSLRAVENLLSLEKLELGRNPCLATVSNLPALQVLLIDDCPALQVMENLGGLRRMELQDGDMETLPEYLSEGAVLSAELRLLVIYCSESLLKNICLQREGSPEWPKIKQFQRVSVYSQDESLYAHYIKTPFSFNTNTDTPTISSREPST